MPTSPPSRPPAAHVARRAAAAFAPEPPPRLRYVSDAEPGIRRVRQGEGFVYRDVQGRLVRDEAELQRIRRLAIPPAYTDVWICPLPHGHLQATGRDARGRKQYRYHEAWRSVRDESKFERMAQFGAALPRIRRQVARDLDAGGAAAPGRRQVLATLVRLLDATLVRVGNDEYMRANRSFGLTTLRSRHATVAGARLRLRFRGKSGVLHEVDLQDRAVARIVRRCQALPGQELFQYAQADGSVHAVGSHDVNDYLREAGRGDFTAKDFRTWHASVLALQAWRACLRADAGAGAPRAQAQAVLAEVAARLRNTVAVCRKSYVHPRVLAALEGAAIDAVPASTAPAPLRGLSAPERELLAFVATPRRRARGAAQATPCAANHASMRCQPSSASAAR